MGLHICCLKNNDDHPDWDYIRQGSDRQFPDIVSFDKTYYKDDRDKYEWRPTNIPELRQKIEATDWEDKARYLHLLDILEQDTDTWLYFSW